MRRGGHKDRVTRDQPSAIRTASPVDTDLGPLMKDTFWAIGVLGSREGRGRPGKVGGGGGLAIKGC